MLCLSLGLWVPVATAEVEVRVEGLNDELLANVRTALSVVQFEGQDQVDLGDLKRRHAMAPAEIKAALQPFGRYNVEVTDSWAEQGGDTVLTYQVDPGSQTTVAWFDVAVTGEGSGLDSLESVLRDWPLRAGAPLLHARYEAAKARLLQSVVQEGYLDARYLRSEMRVFPERSESEISLELDTGPRWYFGATTIEAAGLEDAFLRRYIRMSEGLPFEPRRLLDTQFALTELGYFQSVEIIPERDKADGRMIPVTVRAPLRSERRHEIGLGYGTDTGFRLGAATEWRHIGQSGHQLRAEMRLSEIKDTYGGEYLIPVGRTPGESVGLKGASEVERFEVGESLKYVVGLSLNRRPGRWQRRVYLEYHHEESDVSGTSNSSDLVIPGVSITRTEVDDPIHARKGWYTYFDLHGASENALSTSTFLQARTLLRASVPLGARARLLGRVEYGANVTEDFADLPLSQRFFAGGDQSVRGYGYQSLGPKDVQGRAVGGKYLTTVSGEMEMRVWQNWGGALFIDAGGVDSDVYPRLFRGVGAGVRYRAPIGQINIDLAHPLDGDRRGVRLHLNVRVGL